MVNAVKNSGSTVHEAAAGVVVAVELIYQKHRST